MPRTKRGFKAGRRRNRILKHASGYHSARSRLFAYAKEVVMKAWVYAYAHRRRKKRDFRRHASFHRDGRTPKHQPSPPHPSHTPISDATITPFSPSGKSHLFRQGYIGEDNH